MPGSSRSISIALVATQIALALAGSFFTYNRALADNKQNNQPASTLLIAASEEAAVLPPDVKREKAPPLAGGIGYLNPDQPVTLEKLAGRFLVLDFWTFCCINCMHILPHLDELEQKYGDRLSVVGIHSAKFENEKDTANIDKAIVRYGIKHPVINDADFKIWDAYNVRAWPTLILIDPESQIIGRFSGEGHTAEIAALIDKLSPIYKARGTLKLQEIKESGEKQATSELSFPGKVVLSGGKKQLFIADTGHNRILIANLSPDGKSATIDEVIGSGLAGFKNGSFSQASFNHPQGLCQSGDLIFVADTQNNAIRKIDLLKHSVETFSGTGEQAKSHARGGALKTTALNSPWDIISSPDILTAMAGSHQIWISRPESIEPFAGSGREDLKDGPWQTAAMAQPSGITYSDKNLYVADAEASAIRSINIGIGDRTITTLIGKGLFVFGDVDGDIANARLQHPLGICSAGDKLYIADSYNHKIKCLDLRAKTIATIAGSGKSGYKDGPQAQFAEPGGLTLNAETGKIYVADTNNSVIRVITLPQKAGESSLTDTLKLIGKR